MERVVEGGLNLKSLPKRVEVGGERIVKEARTKREWDRRREGS